MSAFFHGVKKDIKLCESWTKKYLKNVNFDSSSVETADVEFPDPVPLMVPIMFDITVKDKIDDDY